VFTHCVTLTTADVNAYPTFSFYLDQIGIPLNVTPSIYLYECDGPGTYSLGITTSASSGTGQVSTILGATFMEAFHVAFDRINNQVGFAPQSTCPAIGVYTTGGVAGSPTTTASPGSTTGPQSSSNPSSSTSTPHASSASPLFQSQSFIIGFAIIVLAWF